MPQITGAEVMQSVAKVGTVVQQNPPVDWLKILDKVWDLFQQYQAMQAQRKPSDMESMGQNVINNRPQIGPPKGVAERSQNQVNVGKEALAFVEKFLTEKVGQGQGDKPIGQVIAELDIPTKDVLAMLQALKMMVK